jgi:co-chaperonin GroES (HSP10)
MKKNNFFAVLAVIIFISGLSFSQEKLGKEITLEEKTEISEIISNPSEYLGEKVLIEGEILSVCEMAGCWMEVANEEGDKIRVKVKDGDIVFPKDGIGKKALVEGEVYKIDLDEEEAKDYFEHMAEESNQEFDPSTVKGPVTIYQIKGFGAVIN